MIKKLFYLFCLFASALLLAFSLATTLPILAVSADSQSKLLVTEVKLGGAVGGQPTEFIELYNTSSEVLNFDTSDWFLELAKPAAQITDCAVIGWASMDSSSQVRTIRLTGMLAPGEFKIIETSLNDNQGGSLRLRNGNDVQDLVGWSSGASTAICANGTPAAIPSNTKSLQRPFRDSRPVSTTENANDFVISDVPTPGLPTIEQPSLPDPEPTEICEQIVVSEILPNPAGDDTGKEYIELHNTASHEVSLAGCVLGVGTARQSLEGTIPAGGYRAIYGLTLPNAAGGSVDLMMSSGTSSIIYPADLGDDKAYGLVDGVWYDNLLPTPGTANQFPDTTSENNEQQDEPCAPGKFRNPETGRCKNIEVESPLTPCKPGQERNPETNRCRNTATTSSTLTPCKPGQERNPDTNRCRNTTSATKSLTPCKEGQERNPETNRCRNVASAKSTNPMNDPKTESKPVSFFVLGAVALLAAGYGVYEYRANIQQFFMGRFGRA